MYAHRSGAIQFMLNNSYEKGMIKLMTSRLEEEEGWRKEASCPPGWLARPSSKDTTGVEMEFLSPSMEIFPGVLEMLTHSKQLANNHAGNLVDPSDTIDNILDDPSTVDAMEEDLKLLSRETLASSSSAKSVSAVKEPILPAKSTSSSSRKLAGISITSSSSKLMKEPPMVNSTPTIPSSLEKRKALPSSASSKKPRMELKASNSSPKNLVSTKSAFEIAKTKALKPEKLSTMVTTSEKATSASAILPSMESSMQITKVGTVRVV